MHNNLAHPADRFSAYLCGLFLSLLTFAALYGTQLAAAEPPSPTVSSRAPDLVAKEFYGWYLESLAADTDPLTDQRNQLAKYITKDLLAEIDRQSHSPDGMAEDYFLKAQDYLDDWLSNRVTSKPARHGTSTVVVVTLGATPETRRSLKLTMVREKTSWKIRHVSLANPVGNS